MSSLYIFAANLVATLHLGWAFIIVGGAVGSMAGALHKNKRLQELYLAVLGGTLISFIVYQTCLLTLWEVQLRQLASGSSDNIGSFLYRLLKWFGIEISETRLFYITTVTMLIGLVATVFWNLKGHKNA